MSTESTSLSLGDRMKQYEAAYSFQLPCRIPVIIRLDGRSFHNWTKKLQKPFDEAFIESMGVLALHLCQEVQSTQLAYVQSDEISLLLHNYKRLATQPFFGNEIQKMVSISAGIASAFFTQLHGRIAVFDSRVFLLPEAEVTNYFIWRQRDAIRNSILMAAKSVLSHRDMQGKNTTELQEMMLQKGIDWNGLTASKRRGQTIFKNQEGEWKIDDETSLFSKDREYIEKWLVVENETDKKGD